VEGNATFGNEKNIILQMAKDYEILSVVFDAAPAFNGRGD
jgi:hypothetical protein